MAEPQMQGMESITQAEHISPEKTGDNIQAKRVALYAWDGTAWGRFGGGFVSEAYDYIDVDESGATTDVYTFKTGGSSGTVVATVTITYTNSSKGNINYVEKT